MSDEILGQVALGYSAFIDRNRAVSATRLTVFPLKPDAVLDAAQLLEAVASVWPPEGGRVSLNVTSEALLQDLLRSTPSHNLMVEVPAFMAANPANTESIVALHAHGTTLMLKGRPLKELPREVLPCFKQAIIDLSDDRRVAQTGAAAPAGVARNIPHVLAGIHSVADMDGAFDRGAVAVLGWPIGDEVTERPKSSREKSAPIDLQTVVELMSQVDREEPVEKIENTLKRDPSLGFKVLRYINSPAFGLSVEISSFSHAVMLLGYQRLKRWLALLLATASKEPNMKAAMFASVRRGLLMEELARHIGDQEMRNELFICGVFSLLDRLFQQPLGELLKTVPVPQRVYETLVDGTGPYAPYYRLVQAIEAGSLYDFRECADALMMEVREINRAELRALAAAAELD